MRHIHLSFLCLQVLHSFMALGQPDLERVVQSGTAKPGYPKAAAEDPMVCNCRGICCSPRKSWHRKSNMSLLKPCAALNPVCTSILTVNRVRFSLHQNLPLSHQQILSSMNYPTRVTKLVFNLFISFYYMHFC